MDKKLTQLENAIHDHISNYNSHIEKVVGHLRKIDKKIADHDALLGQFESQLERMMGNVTE